MKRKAIAIVLSIICIACFIPYKTYAQELQYPKIEELKGKKELLVYLKEVNRIRANMSTINIVANNNLAELNNAERYIKTYILELDEVRNKLQNHRKEYKDSFSDLYFSEQIQFIGDSYIISLRMQENLIKQLKLDNEDSKKLFESDYLTPAYYYITLGDQMYIYIMEYFNIA